MAVVCGLLRVSWISFLLISSVTCLPAPKDHGSPGISNPAPGGFVGWLSTSGSSYPNADGLDGGASLSSTSGSLLQFPAAQNSNNKPGSVGLGGSFSGPQATGSINNAGVSNAGYYSPTGAYGSLASTGYGNSGYGNTGVDNGLGSVGLGGSFSSPQATGSKKGSVSNAGGSKGGHNAPTGAYGSLASAGYGNSGYGNTGVGTGLGSVGLGGSFSGPQVTGHVSNAAVPFGAYYSQGGYASRPSTGNDGRWYGGYSNAGDGAGLYYTNSGSTDGDGGSTQFYHEGAVEESPEPVLSDLSDLEPVYTYKSRSRYQQGRSQFYQTHYSPGEVQLQPVAVSRPEQSVQAPAKGGF